MKLYINSCHNCTSRIPLSITAANRQQLRYSYGNAFSVQCPVCHTTRSYTPNSVWAETNSNAAVGVGTIGGLIGLLGGPLGAVLGAAIGGAIGNTNDTADRNSVAHFNASH